MEEERRPDQAGDGMMGDERTQGGGYDAAAPRKQTEGQGGGREQRRRTEPEPDRERFTADQLDESIRNRGSEHGEVH